MKKEKIFLSAILLVGGTLAMLGLVASEWFMLVYFGWALLMAVLLYKWMRDQQRRAWADERKEWMNDQA